MLALINRTRANPTAEGQRLLSLAQTDPLIHQATLNWNLGAFYQTISSYAPEPPLAFNPRLIDAALAETNAMLAANAQRHAPAGYLNNPAVATDTDGQPFYNTGNLSWATGENIFAYCSGGEHRVIHSLCRLLRGWVPARLGQPRLRAPQEHPRPRAGRGEPGGRGLPVLRDRDRPADQRRPDHPRRTQRRPGDRDSGVRLAAGRRVPDRDFLPRRAEQRFLRAGRRVRQRDHPRPGTNGQGTFQTQTWSTGGYSLQLPRGHLCRHRVRPGPRGPGHDDHDRRRQRRLEHRLQPRPGRRHPRSRRLRRVGACRGGHLPPDERPLGDRQPGVGVPLCSVWPARRHPGSRALRRRPGRDRRVPPVERHLVHHRTQRPLRRPVRGAGRCPGAGRLRRRRPDRLRGLPPVHRTLVHLAQFDPDAAGHQWGIPYLDQPVPAAYDGGGRTEIAVLRPTTYQWFIITPTGNRVVQYGGPGTIPVPADYDGSAAPRSPSTSPPPAPGSSGPPGESPTTESPASTRRAPADYDGDGRTDLASTGPPRRSGSCKNRTGLISTIRSARGGPAQTLRTLGTTSLGRPGVWVTWIAPPGASQTAGDGLDLDHHDPDRRDAQPRDHRRPCRSSTPQRHSARSSGRRASSASSPNPQLRANRPGPGDDGRYFARSSWRRRRRSPPSSGSSQRRSSRGPAR